jgi:hypothetical protein
LLLYSEGGTTAQQADAHTVLELLVATYPGHPWAVRVDGGVIFIRHLEFPGNWGMVVKFNDVKHDAAVFKKEITMKTGEFLERAGLVRGRYDDSPIVRVDGVPEKFQPPSQKAPVEAVMANPVLRDTPRPQAVKA